MNNGHVLIVSAVLPLTETNDRGSIRVIRPLAPTIGGRFNHIIIDTPIPKDWGAMLITRLLPGGRISWTKSGAAVPEPIKPVRETHSCPRRDEIWQTPAFALPQDDTWTAKNTCSYCGSLNPDEFMTRLEAGLVALNPTDKSYKVYVTPKGGSPELGAIKFYFQHLNAPQKARFVNLLNSGQIEIGYPGRFYRPPYFVREISDKGSLT